jgi:hypothetical protein
MLLKGRKSNSNMMDYLNKIILYVMYFFVLVAVCVALWNAIMGTSLNSQVREQFDVFDAQLKSIIYSSNNYVSGYSQILLPGSKLTSRTNDYYMLAFSGSRDIIVEGLGTIRAPPTCRAPHSCICIYKSKPLPGKPKSNVLDCKMYDVDVIVANHISETPLMKPSKNNNKFWFADPNMFVGTALGASNVNQDITNFIESLSAYYTTWSTKYLGFCSSSNRYLPLHYFAIKSADFQVISFYVEKTISSSDLTVLSFFPYYSTLNTRKYFIHTYNGIGDCDQKYKNTAIFNQTSDKFNYCLMKSDNLDFVKDEGNNLIEIPLCDVGFIYDTCACGGAFDAGSNNYFYPPRAVSTGACYSDLVITPDKDNVLINFPPGFCDELESDKCKTYKEEYSCNSNICGVDGGAFCTWVGTKCKNR